MHRREQLFHYTKWLRGIPWQLFATLTFAWRVSDAQAEQIFKIFIERLESYFRSPITFLRGEERRFSGCGKPAVPLHFHVMLASAVPLDPVYIHDVWTRLAGDRKNGAGADVRFYDAEQDALKYTLKFAVSTACDFGDRNFGEWNFGNLDLFLPRDHSMLNARARRRLSRHALRVQEAQARTSSHTVLAPAVAGGSA